MELLITTLQVTVIGMGIVFLVLFLLSLILQLFESLLYKEEKVTKPSRPVRSKVRVQEGKGGEDETVAVITAVMASLLEDNEYIANIKAIN
ncbi:MAG: hypothetical protein FH762_07125 [Firmicutes bacterium]|nr:hypothetical protein [Bacillota bacterium]